MTQSNRAITSREYKLMLNIDRFQDRPAGVATFWDLVEFLAAKQGGQIVEQEHDLKKRRTLYLDTAGLDLYRQGFALRLRTERNGQEYKVNLKYRGPDRYVSASQDLSSTVDGKSKFEEDILPPFTSKFARSVSVEFDSRPDLADVDKVTTLFPGLKGLNLPGSTPLEVVNNFEAYEVVHEVGQILFDQEPLVKASLSFWYWLTDGEEKPPGGRFPVVGEFSFDYDVVSKPKEDELELFPPQMVKKVNYFFEALQKQAGWVDLSGSTKTAFGYTGL